MQRLLDHVAAQPWSDLAWLPDRMSPGDRWPDMDVDPRPVFAATACPVLAVWGEDDPWVPMPEPESEAAWRAAAADRLTVLRLPGVGHGPDPSDPRYEQALLARVGQALGI